ncbi:MAG TPA: hypothetical protein VIM61_13980 [Chthoniobacterales bacterium]|jgi:uncharacterized metal-binding protein YceD (DUF177 family)
MKIHLRQIPQDTTVHLTDELDPAFLELDPEEATAITPVHCALDVGVSGGGLFATGRITVGIRLTCVKCLNEFDTTFVVPDFAAQVELDGRESVDLTPEIREDILLVLPTHPRCDADGRTKCPATFRSAPAAPLTEEVEPSTWSALDQIKPKK